MRKWVCSKCEKDAFYDGRCGDSPVLVCGCDRVGRKYIPDRCGMGYYTNPSGAEPVLVEDGPSGGWHGTRDSD